MTRIGGIMRLSRSPIIVDDIETLFYDQMDVNEQMSTRPANAIIIEGYATRWGVRDREGEVFKKGAFTKSLKLSEHAHGVFMLWQHDENTWPVGKWTTLREDDVGLWCRGSIYPKDRTIWGASPDLMGAVWERKVSELSVGVYPVASYNMLGRHVVTEAWLTEISIGQDAVLPGATFSIVNR